jgi:hypothetical protein
VSRVLCKRCGEEIAPWEYGAHPGICHDCYVYHDMARFTPIQDDKTAAPKRDEEDA